MFTVEELDLFLSKEGTGNPNTRRALLTYYRKQGRILPVRRGLYAVVPFGSSPDSSPVDLCLLACKMTKDAVLGYHTALEFHGKAYSVYNRFHYLSTQRSLPVKFRSYEIRRVAVPQPLIVEDSHLKQLRKLRPQQPHYLLRSRRKHGRWMKKWNLMVPDEILNQSWGEVL